LVVSIRTAVFAARSLPQQQIEALLAAQNEVAQQRVELTAVQSKVASWRVEIENLLDQVDASLEITERKRRSMASSASRVKAAEERAAAAVPAAPVADALTERQLLEQRARAQGLI